MGVTFVRYGDKRNAYRIVGAKTQSERPQRRQRSGWEDNIKMVLKVDGRGTE
jgi:hypothetical protein